MAGIRVVFEKGPLTFLATTVANGGNIPAGVFVEPDGTGTGATRIKPATAGSVKVLGVAIGDASGSNFSVSNATDAWGRPTVDHGLQPPNEVAVAYQGVWRLKVVGRVEFGDPVKVGAGGLPTAHGAGTAATLGQVVGRCVEPGGIADGAVGKILVDCGVGA